jgi:serine/threonine protein kinase
MAQSTQRRILHPGDRIADFIVRGILGHGGFADIYFVESKLQPGNNYAMKLEPISGKRNGLFNERNIFQQIQGSPYFPRFIDAGKTLRFRYLVMERLGPSLADIRRALPLPNFSLSTGLRVGIESLRAVQAFHERGFVHRDVKPSNFLLQPTGRPLVVLADYGVARRLTEQHQQPQTQPGNQRRPFVGTPKYASLRAHEGRQLGRGDDIVSWTFSLLETLTGTLPWPSIQNYEEVHKAKKSANLAEFCKTLPKQIAEVYNRAARYGEDDEPEYDALAALLGDAMDNAGCDWEEPFDWETLSDDQCNSLAINVPHTDGSLSANRPRKSSSPGETACHLCLQQPLDQHLNRPNTNRRKMCGESVPTSAPCSVL